MRMASATGIYSAQQLHDLIKTVLRNKVQLEMERNLKKCLSEVA